MPFGNRTRSERPRRACHGIIACRRVHVRARNPGAVTLKIAVLFGGTSEERDVSIASAAQIVPALRGLGHEVFAVDTASGRLPPAQETKLLVAGVAAAPPSGADMLEVRGRAAGLAANAVDIRDADVVFLALHGGAGEDG